MLKSAWIQYRQELPKMDYDHISQQANTSWDDIKLISFHSINLIFIRFWFYVCFWKHKSDIGTEYQFNIIDIEMKY